jgi:hypothetical protein
MFSSNLVDHSRSVMMMTNKLEKTPNLNPLWGENTFAIVAQKTGSRELVEAAEADVEKRYRLELRDKFQNDKPVYDALVESKDSLLSEGTFESIRGLTKIILRAGTEEIFERILRELLEELNEMHKREPSAYLVNRQTGKVLMPMSGKDVYTPPDYVGEDGKLHPAKPILHPAIAAPLMMHVHGENRKLEAIAKAPNFASVEHLVQGPESILERAKILLRNQGIIVEQLDMGERRTIEVGRETVDDMLQAPNYSFHRSQMYGSLLAKKVLDICREYMTHTCDLQSIRLHKGSKEQFYVTEIVVSFAATPNPQG